MALSVFGKLRTIVTRRISSVRINADAPIR
jgi:hypothetical protein